MIISKTNNHRVNIAIEEANKLLRNEDFLKQIYLVDDFEYTYVNGEYIANALKDFASGKQSLILYVYTYRSKNPWSRVLGYFIPSKPNNTYINSRKLNRSMGSIVATIIHELIHMIDNFDNNASYGHGDNSPVGKQYSVPYWVDNLAQSFIDKKPIQNDESSNIVTYVPWYKKIWNWIF